MIPHRLCILFLAMLFSPALASAQKNFKPAYVITAKGDTLSGFIDYSKWDGSPKHIKFKPANANEAVSLPSQNIRLLSIPGKGAYRYYAGPITLDRIQENLVSTGRDTSFRMDTVFLKVLQQGPILSLYTYSDDMKTRFYITEKDTETPKELVYRVYFDNDNVDIVLGKGRTVNEDTYKTQLYDIAVKNGVASAKLLGKMKFLRYSKGYLLEMVSAINGISH